MNKVNITMIKYWKELVFFGVICAIYTICSAPGLTWAGYGSDIGDFFGAAKYGQVLHAPGHAFYTIWAFIAMRIPIGSEGWRLSYFASTIPALITIVLVFLVTKKIVKNKIAPYVASVVTAGSNIFLMQASIPESYAITTMLLLMMYLLCLDGRYTLASINLGLIASMHTLGWVAIPVFFIAYRPLRKKWLWFIATAFVMYAFTLIRGMYGESFSIISGSLWGILQYIIGTAADNNKWWFSLPIWQIPWKIGSAIVILTVSFGAGLFAAILGYRRWRVYPIPVVMSIAPLAYYLGCVTDITTKIVFLSAPFIGILAGIGVSYCRKEFAYMVFAISLALLLALPSRYDIGNTLDPNMSAQLTYNQFFEIPDGSIVVGLGKYEHNDETLLMGVSGREQTLLHTFNKYNGTHNVPVNISMYVSGMRIEGYDDIGDYYRKNLENEYGIEAPYCGGYDISGDKSEIYVYWVNIHCLWEANKDRTVYYSTVIDSDPFLRILTPYNGEWREWLIDY